MDNHPLRQAFHSLLDAATTVANRGHGNTEGPIDGWNADQILAHVSLVSAATITAVSSVASGAVMTYDNRLASDSWTIDRVIGLAGGNASLRERVRLQGEALCALVGPALSEAELDTLVPALLLSNNAVLVDQPMSLRDVINGLAHVELPGHTKQLLALPSSETGAEVTTRVYG